MRSPSMRREWIEMITCANDFSVLIMSPSMRREWIEMHSRKVTDHAIIVSLHAEGVD